MLTQEELAARSQLSVSTVRGLEAGRVLRPRPASLRLLAEALTLSGPERDQLLVAAGDGVGARTAGRSVPAGSSEISDEDPAHLAYAATGMEAAPRSVEYVLPRQLPAPPQVFIGRASEISLMLNLRDSSTAVVTAIDGMAGVGKTALAVHWAHRVRDRFPDGQLYINLCRYSSGTPLPAIEALARLLEGLGMPAPQIPSDVDRAAATYRSLMADRQTLLVLDDAASVEQVRPLLPGGAGCFVVVTSRRRLDGLVARDGARRVSLDVLTPDEARTLLSQMLGGERVEQEPQATSELARLCGHLPLALRIAAANLAAHPTHRITDYVTRLSRQDPAAVLEVTGDAQSSVKVAFDLSYDRLPAPARQLFRLLGTVPVPDISIAAAATLMNLDADRAARLLETLASACLVQEPAPGRYSSHDLLRRYAASRAEREDDQPARQAAVERLFGYYLWTAESAARLLYPEKLRLPVPAAYSGLGEPLPGRAAALAWLEAEMPGLVTVARHTATHGPQPIAWLLSSVLRGYFWFHRGVVDWLAVAEAGRAAADAAGHPAAQTTSRLALGDAYQMTGDDRLAAEHYHHALRTSEQCETTEYQAAVLNNLGMIHERLGQLPEAAHHYQRAIEVNRRAGHRSGEAVQLGNLGGVLKAQGQLDRAADHHTRALAIHRELDNQAMQAGALHDLGATYAAQGRYPDALQHLHDALALHQQTGSRACEATALLLLAGVQRDLGTPDNRPCHTALTHARELGDRHLEAEALNTLGTIERQQGHHQSAINHHHQALAILEQVKSPPLLAETLTDLASTHLDQCQHESAQTHLWRALDITERAGLQITRARALTLAAKLTLAQADPTRATNLAETALAIYRDTGHRPGEAHAELVLAQTRQEAR